MCRYVTHRNNIKEMKGIWMEEWHQKLHNNTTPDDIVICEAYIAFLKADMDLSEYWRVLGEGGVTRERLEGFERPIRKEPTPRPEIKVPLIKDFLNYLKILKSVHSGRTDTPGFALPGVTRLDTWTYRLSSIGCVFYCNITC